MTNASRHSPWRFHHCGDSWFLEWKRSDDAIGSPFLHLDNPHPPRPIVMSRRQTEALIAARRLPDPALFIFHVSHCGSTLLAQLLRTDPSLRVAIEPPYVGRFLSRTYELAPGPFSDIAAPMIRLCGFGLGDGQRLVIKFSSHALHRMKAIRECFPDVPAVLVYRDPVSVLARSSATTWGFLNRRPRWLLDLLGPDHGDAASMTREAVSAAYLDGLFRKAVQYSGLFTRLINYDELPGVLHEVRAGVLGLREKIADQDVRNVAGRYSKDPSRPFPHANHAADAQPSAFVRSAAARWLMPHYAALESCRRNQLEPHLARHA